MVDLPFERVMRESDAGKRLERVTTRMRRILHIPERERMIRVFLWRDRENVCTGRKKREIRAIRKARIMDWRTHPNAETPPDKSI
jgi:hypothetical protein